MQLKALKTMYTLSKMLMVISLLLTIHFSTALTMAQGPDQLDSAGTDFWLTFPGNYVSSRVTTLHLFITGEMDTTGTVTIPGTGFSTSFTVTAGTVSEIVLPLDDAYLGTSLDIVEDKGVHIEAQDEVTVYGLNRQQFTTDAYLGLPTDILGTEYINLGYGNPNFGPPTQFAIVGTEDNTTVTIIPTETTNGHGAGVPYDITLNQGQTYQLWNNSTDGDLTGSVITADKPIAVFGGHRCANIPVGYSFCDTLVEQLPPTSSWGQAFVTMPLATRLNGDTFRFVASTNNTTITINSVDVATLNRAEFYEQIVEGPAHITANNPILVAQYSHGTQFDGVTSDPFMMFIPPFEQFLGRYTISTPASGFQANYVNVVVSDTAVGNIILDGVPIPAADFTAIGSSGFSGVQVSVPLGAHNLSGPVPFGVFSYGFDRDDSYGYPGGTSLAEVAEVTNLTLTPATSIHQVGTEGCVTAAVTDQNDAPLAGIRVDFMVEGTNTTTGFAFTNANGEAVFCYTGSNAGNDTITASIGTLSSTAAKTWEDTTAISLISFTAISQNGYVTLNWETASEIDNEGFNLWRSQFANDSYIKINEALIPAQGNVDTGATYTYLDQSVSAGKTYYYRLEDIDTHGVSTFHDLPTAVDTIVSSNYHTYIPVLVR